MTTNRIVETKTVDEENFEFLLAQSDYKLNAVFRSKNSQVNIYPNNPMIATPNNVNTTLYAITTPGDKSKSASFSFDINHTTNALIDLKDFYFDINAFGFANCKASIQATENTDGARQVADEIATPALDHIKWANQPLLSLFNDFQLYIDDVLVERSNQASLSANARYALEYPHNPTAEKTFQANGWQYSDFYNEPAADGTTTIKSNMCIKTLINKTETHSGTDCTFTSLVYSNICEKIKLSDIFSCINTLPPLFNHSVRILVNRANSSFIGVDTGAINKPNLADYVNASAAKMELDAFQQFKLCGCSYIITDQLKNACEKYYSKKIETLFTARDEMINTIPSTPGKSSELSFVINTNLAYKNKCLVIAIPRVNSQAGLIQPCTPCKKINDAAPHVTNGIQFSEYHKNYNDYTTGGLAQLQISTGNGLMLADYTMDRDGITDKMALPQSDVNTGFDVQLTLASPKIYNYLEVYHQYLKCREHFNQLPEEGIDYISFLKSYCIYCVDLSPFDITQNEQIRVTMKFGDWANDYNPFYLYNYQAVDNNWLPTGQYTSNLILVNLYSDKILRLLPNSRCEIAQLFSEPESNTINNSVQNVNETQ